MTVRTLATVPIVGRGGRLWPVSRALAARSILAVTRIPAAVVPVLAMPIFFVVAFGGSYSRLTALPGFPTDNILNWMVPFAILQGAAFGGLGTAFGAARDLEGGFYDRLLLSPAPRGALLLGPVLASLARALLPTTIVTLVGLIGGARFDGGPVGFLSLVVAAEGVALLSALWGLGIVYRLKTQRSGALIQAGIFVAMFLTIGMVPLAVMNGWLHAVATYNPMTNILRLARQGVIGDVAWSTTWPGLVALAGGALVLGVFALRGLRRVVP